MQTFSARQWLLIDLANHMGHDKALFDVRLEKGREYLNTFKDVQSINELANTIEPLLKEADEPEMAAASCLAIFDSLQQKASGYTVGLDAVNSGVQLLSVLTCCESGMKATGCINTGVRPDFYALVGNNMGITILRDVIKKGIVPYMYASEAIPMDVFGDNFDDFENAYKATVPGAAWAKDTLVNTWNSHADYHEWVLPDGHTSHVKVINTVDTQGKFKGRSFTYRHSEQGTREAGENKTKANAANVTHSWDAYVLRELDARCNHNKDTLRKAITAIELHLTTEPSEHDANPELVRISELGLRFNAISIHGIEFVKRNCLNGVDEEYLKRLRILAQTVLDLPSFHTKDVHDEFSCLPNYVNTMKYHYNCLLAESYASTWLFDVIEDLSGISYHDKMTRRFKEEMLDEIMDNDYSLC